MEKFFSQVGIGRYAAKVYLYLHQAVDAVIRETRKRETYGFSNTYLLASGQER